MDVGLMTQRMSEGGEQKRRWSDSVPMSDCGPRTVITLALDAMQAATT